MCIHVHILSSCPPFFLPADFKERAGSRQNPGLSQSCALNPKQQRSALLVLSLPTNNRHTRQTLGFGGWRKCTSPEPSICLQNFDPIFPSLSSLDLQEVGTLSLIDAFVFVFNVIFLHNMLLPICFLFFLLCWRLM